MLNHVNNMNHDAAHYMIQALSMTDDGHKLVKALDSFRCVAPPTSKSRKPPSQNLPT